MDTRPDTYERLQLLHLEVLQLLLVGGSIDRDVHGQHIGQAPLVAQPARLHALDAVLQLELEGVGSGGLQGLAQALHAAALRPGHHLQQVLEVLPRVLQTNPPPESRVSLCPGWEVVILMMQGGVG